MAALITPTMKNEGLRIGTTHDLEDTTELVNHGNGNLEVIDTIEIRLTVFTKKDRELRISMFTDHKRGAERWTVSLSPAELKDLVYRLERIAKKAIALYNKD